MLAGPRYSGKSTLSLALAARGHHFLSDEIAWYIPSTRHLTAFRRPVGVREHINRGVRSRQSDAVIPQHEVAHTREHGKQVGRLRRPPRLPRATQASPLHEIVEATNPRYASCPRAAAKIVRAMITLNSGTLY